MEPTLVRRIPGQLCGCPIDIVTPIIFNMIWTMALLSSSLHIRTSSPAVQIADGYTLLVTRYWQSNTMSFKCCVRVNTVKSIYNFNYASCYRHRNFLSFFARTSCTWYRTHRAGWLLRMTYQELGWTLEPMHGGLVFFTRLTDEHHDIRALRLQNKRLY